MGKNEPKLNFPFAEWCSPSRILIMINSGSYGMPFSGALMASLIIQINCSLFLSVKSISDSNKRTYTCWIIHQIEHRVCIYIGNIYFFELKIIDLYFKNRFYSIFNVQIKIYIPRNRCSCFESMNVSNLNVPFRTSVEIQDCKNWSYKTLCG